jgi:hypothetical protein
MKTTGHHYEDKLLDFAYGELPASEASAVSDHAKGCPRCAAHLTEIESTRHRMGGLEVEPAPTAGLESLLAYAEQTAKRNLQLEKPAALFLKRFFAPMMSFGALAVVALIAWQNSNERLAPDAATASLQLKKEAKSEATDIRRGAEEIAAQPAVATASPEPVVALSKPKTPMVVANSESLEKFADKVSEPQGLKEFTKNDEGLVPARKPNMAMPVRGDLAYRETPARPVPSAVQESKDSAQNNAPAPRKQADEDVSRLPAMQNAVQTPRDVVSDVKGGSAGLGQQEPERKAKGSQPVSESAVVSRAAPMPLSGKKRSFSVPSLSDPKQAPSVEAAAAPQASDGEKRSQLAEVNTPTGAGPVGKVEATKRTPGNVDAFGGVAQPEIQRDRATLEAGATGTVRALALKRLCDAYDALGNAAAARPYCEALIAEFPRSAAAQVVSRRKAEVDRAKKQAAPTESLPAEAH